ncbi:dolichyl-P-Man:Man(5)GlcNAc(2)-PP-dolichyl mannosyltransferase [Boletus reticuloceps]|uniref:Dol-P-Man:Man(5)GlcNAc(2)-PP-Dol alpha-1,3-mannosyltransferase n=1 Tax=Boletus reticuloceps TaxID=495285 RepID=A0A8I2YQR9_9AGAM|nr:dolichyl-P-Man:Man(5)GlcNAc(2)-PP-dolichyl mannosyltransferase [Boletus reticuloceps]
MSNPTHVVSSSGLLRSGYELLRSLLLDKRYFWVLCGIVILGDAFLTQLIIHFIPYTEIDWETYMVHVNVYLKGERNYAEIDGPTGPLVYPAGHVHIHHLLYRITDAGRNIGLAQQIYGASYIASLVLVCCVYRQGGASNWTVLLLPLSKRLHSIFVLRLFNDCWSLLLVQAAILALQRASDDLGILLFSLALSVKMSALLYLPGLLVILFKRHGLMVTMRHLLVVAATQIVLARSFLAEDARAYFQNAFDLSRMFMYKWTVNWRFLDEQTFLSRSWARGLLVGHVTVLVAFGLFRWCRSDGGVAVVLRRGFRSPMLSPSLSPVSADYVATVLMTSNLIGILFARSLHYQFYSWYFQHLPFLAQRTKYPLLLQLLIIVGIEYAWNVFPSTSLSSGILLASHCVLLFGIWFGYVEGKQVKS